MTTRLHRFLGILSVRRTRHIALGGESALDRGDLRGRGAVFATVPESATDTTDSIGLHSTPPGRVVSDDPNYPSQRNLEKIGMEQAWAITTGSTKVVVAVIDSGVDYTNPDLAGNMWRNPGETGLDSEGRDKRRVHRGVRPQGAGESICGLVGPFQGGMVDHVVKPRTTHDATSRAPSTPMTEIQPYTMNAKTLFLAVTRALAWALIGSSMAVHPVPPWGHFKIGTRSKATVVIHDSLPWIDILASRAVEGGALLRAYRTGGDFAMPLSFDVSTGAAGTALPGVDFTPTKVRLEFAAREQYAQFTISNLVDNSEVNLPKTVELRLANPSMGGTLARTQAVVTVLDNEYSPNLDLGFSPPLSSVYDWAVQPDGKILVSGVGTNGASAFIRLHTNGTFDPSFEVKSDGKIHHIAVLDNGTVLVTGEFYSMDGEERSGLAKLLPNGRLDRSFNPAVSGVNVHIGRPDGKPPGSRYVAVSKVTVLRQGRYLIRGVHALVAIRSDGELDFSFNQNLSEALRPVLTELSSLEGIAEQHDGRLLVWFPLYSTRDEARLLRLNQDGTRDLTFTTFTAERIVSALPLADGRIMVHVIRPYQRDSPSAPQLVRLKGDGTLDGTFAWKDDASPDDFGLVAEADGDVIVQSVRFPRMENLGAPGYNRCVNGSFALLRLKENGTHRTEFVMPLRWGSGISRAALDTSRNGAVYFSREPIPGEREFPPVLSRVLLDETTTSSFVLSRTPPKCPSSYTYMPVVSESQGGVDVSVIRLGSSAREVSVAIATRDGSAQAGKKYVATSQIIRFAPLEVEKTVRIPLIDDAIWGGTQNLHVDMVNASDSKALLGPPLTVEVYDDDTGIIPGSVHLINNRIAFQWSVLPDRRSVVERSNDLRTWETIEERDPPHNPIQSGGFDLRTHLKAVFFRVRQLSVEATIP